jgi:hypothetical protein
MPLDVAVVDAAFEVEVADREEELTTVDSGITGSSSPTVHVTLVGVDPRVAPRLWSSLLLPAPADDALPVVDASASSVGGCGLARCC